MNWKTLIRKTGQRLAIGLTAFLLVLMTVFVAAQTEIAVLKYRKALESHRLEEHLFAGGEESEEARRKRWEQVPLGSMDLPMSCISGGKATPAVIPVTVIACAEWKIKLWLLLNS